MMLWVLSINAMLKVCFIQANCKRSVFSLRSKALVSGHSNNDLSVIIAICFLVCQRELDCSVFLNAIVGDVPILWLRQRYSVLPIPTVLN